MIKRVETYFLNEDNFAVHTIAYTLFGLLIYYNEIYSMKIADISEYDIIKPKRKTNKKIGFK